MFVSKKFRAQCRQPQRWRCRPTLEALEDRSVPAVITVTGTGDTIAVDGVVTLREALQAANTNAPAGDAAAGDPGLDTINFNLDPSSTQIFTGGLSADEPVIIDGTTQPGFVGTPLIHLRPGNGQSNFGGLGINGGSSTVRGLDLEGYSFAGVVLFGQGGNVITGNEVLFTGALAGSGEGNGILIDNSSNNIIGGTAAGDGNVLFGNVDAGILISGVASTGNQVLGNFIGNSAGTTAIGNGTGIAVAGSDNFIGGTAPGAGNIISGNSGNGVVITGPNNRVEGNLIGTDGSGTRSLGNHGNGVLITANNINSGNIIGGTVPGARNVISGNSGSGVVMTAGGNVLEGNFIGTDVNGVAVLRNSGAGVVVSGEGNTIGGTAAGAGNVISGNVAAGVQISGGQNNQVQGNRIGTDVLGTSNLGNGAAGVEIGQDSNGNSIGGTLAGAGNLISGNRGDGVLIHDSGATGNLVQGNRIGVDMTGAALGNDGTGVAIAGGASNNSVGGTQGGAGNTIAHNDGAGVAVFSGAGNRIAGNLIFANTGLGIDLNANGPTANDPGDADTGANLLQNFPVLDAVAASAGRTTVSGSLASTPNGTFHIEFFRGLAGPSGFGGSALLLGASDVTTNAAGSATFALSFPVALVAGEVVLATATDAAGNTSEFSAPVQPGLPTVPQHPTPGPNQGPLAGPSLAATLNFFLLAEELHGAITGAVGDVNGDGVQDIVAAAGRGHRPVVVLIDGASAKPVLAFLAFGSRYQGGLRVAAADLNGDGHADVIATTAGSRPRVRLFDGAALATAAEGPFALLGIALLG
jgi:FG-GAP-like repeat